MTKIIHSVLLKSDRLWVFIVLRKKLLVFLFFPMMYMLLLHRQ